jgi:hypothetical protein
MIRNGREQGSRRRRLAPLAGLILAAAAAAGGAGRSAPAGGPGWWEVRLSVAAKGAFTVRGGSRAPVSGEYALRARFEGRLNPDGDDFVLVHLKTETLEWSLRKKPGQGEAAGVREAPDAPAPVLRLNYVLREQDLIELDFAFEERTVPLSASPVGIPLELPASARGAAAGRPGYVGDVLSGSNRIVLPASDLARRRPERTFAWTWTGTKLIEAGGRAYLTVQSHSAEAVVGLVRH